MDLYLQSLWLYLCKILRSFHFRKILERCFLWAPLLLSIELKIEKTDFFQQQLSLMYLGSCKDDDDAVIYFFVFIPAVSVVLRDDCCWWFDSPASLSRGSLCLNHCLCSFLLSVSSFQAFLFFPPGSWFQQWILWVLDSWNGFHLPRAVKKRDII